MFSITQGFYWAAIAVLVLDAPKGLTFQADESWINFDQSDPDPSPRSLVK